MANADDEDALKKHNFRLCRLCIWPNFTGLGFKLESTGQPPHVIQSIESNSPAAAGGLKIRDAILAVNNQDLSDSEYKDVTTAIVNARNSGARIELLVIEKRHYDSLNENGVTFDRRFARAIETPSSMPRDYMNFPKHTPRTCEVRLNAADDSFGFEVVNGEKDIGAFIQEVNSNSPASRTTLRKCDRILEVDDKFVDNEPSKTILGKLGKGQQNRGVKLYVVDTVTYKYFQDNQIPLQSKAYKKSAFAKKNPGLPSYVNIEDGKKYKFFF
jgi:S1-C subfamily serine protease